MQDYKNTILKNIPYLRRYARALTNNHRLADRVVQQCIDCAADLHHLVKEGQDNAAQKIWLFSIFHNIYNEFLKEQSAILAQLYNDVPDSEESTFDLEHDNYHKALTHLPLQQKQVFLLVSVEKFLYEEVSKILNMPLGAILSLLHTARNSIADQVYCAPEHHATEMSVVASYSLDEAATRDKDGAVELSL
jgi:RNA polymerase sigma-70 factor (ECF subfamily)